MLAMQIMSIINSLAVVGAAIDRKIVSGIICALFHIKCIKSIYTIFKIIITARIFPVNHRLFTKDNYNQISFE
jgi:hypothetical protein